MLEFCEEARDVLAFLFLKVCAEVMSQVLDVLGGKSRKWFRNVSPNHFLHPKPHECLIVLQVNLRIGGGFYLKLSYNLIKFLEPGWHLLLG